METGLRILGGGATASEVDELRDEIAEVDIDGTLAANSDTRVASQKATKTYIDARPAVAQPQLIVPDILGRSTAISGLGAMVEKRLTLMRATVLKAGNLRDLAAFVGAKSGKFILAVYDTGEAKAGFYTRLASKELEPAEASRWQIAGDPNIVVTKGQQILIGIIANNAILTIGRGGGGAVSANSGQLPTSFLAIGGGNLPKIAGQLTPAAFEAPAEIAEASLVSLETAAPIPYCLLARIS